MDSNAELHVVGHYVAYDAPRRLKLPQPGIAFSQTMAAIKVGLIVLWRGKIHYAPLPGWGVLDSDRTEYTWAEEVVRRAQLVDAIPAGMRFKATIDRFRGELRIMPHQQSLPGAPKLPTPEKCLEMLQGNDQPPANKILDAAEARLAAERERTAEEAERQRKEKIAQRQAEAEEKAKQAAEAEARARAEAEAAAEAAKAAMAEAEEAAAAVAAEAEDDEEAQIMAELEAEEATLEAEEQQEEPLDAHEAIKILEESETPAPPEEVQPADEPSKGAALPENDLEVEQGEMLSDTALEVLAEINEAPSGINEAPSDKPPEADEDEEPSETELEDHPPPEEAIVMGDVPDEDRPAQEADNNEPVEKSAEAGVEPADQAPA